VSGSRVLCPALKNKITFRPALQEYYDRALHYSPGRHTPHLLEEAFTFLPNWVANGTAAKAWR